MGQFLDVPTAGTGAEAPRGRFLDETPRGQGDRIATPTTPESIQRGFFGEASRQPGESRVRQQLTSRGQETDTFQDIMNVALPMAATLPAETAFTGGVGTLASKAVPQYPRIAGALGRIGASGLLGAAKSGDVQGGVNAAGLAAAWEAALSAIPYIGKGTGSLASLATKAGRLDYKEGQYEAAQAAAGEAYKKLSPFVPKGAWMDVPAISKKPISFLQATRALQKLEGVDFNAARQEIMEALKNPPSGTGSFLSGPALNPPVKASVALGALGKAATPVRDMSQSFGLRTPNTPFQPRGTPMENFARDAVGALASPGVRAAGEAALTKEEPMTGLPLGLAGPLAFKDYAKNFIGSPLRGIRF